MNHPCLPRLAALLGATLLLGCGGGSSPTEAAEPEADLCVTDPELAKTRQPSPPATTSCAQWTDLAQSCDGGDPQSCYDFASCVLLQEMTMKESLSEEEQAQHIAAAAAGLRTACDGGLAEACKLHVGLQMQNGEPLPADGCADIVRACHLGDEEGCAGCRYHECK